MSDGFWFVAGLLCGVTATLVAASLWRRVGAGADSRPRRYVITLGAVAAFALSALLLYLFIGAPGQLRKGGAPQTVAHTGSAGSGKPQSMEAATAALEARLNRDGGSAADWQLLAQSYEFLGRTQEAATARARAAAAPTSGSTSVPGEPSLAATAASLSGLTPAAPDKGASASVPQLKREVTEHPQDAQAWLALATSYRQQRDYPAARSAFERLIRLQSMDAQSWADYADVLGSIAGGSLNGAAGHAIDQALTLEPANAKALWLKASQYYQQKRYAQSLVVWKQLKAVLPADSADAHLVDANIAEASQLSGVAADSGPAAQATPAASEISGTVSIDGRLATRVARDATLFIYAKAADSPGPPLAVIRTTAASWPVSFTLDDTKAMVPSRRLSQFQRVVVEARVSRSGQATPSTGDLYVTSEVLTPSTSRKLALVINREIG